MATRSNGAWSLCQCSRSSRTHAPSNASRLREIIRKPPECKLAAPGASYRLRGRGLRIVLRNASGARRHRLKLHHCGQKRTCRSHPVNAEHQIQLDKAAGGGDTVEVGILCAIIGAKLVRRARESPQISVVSRPRQTQYGGNFAVARISEASCHVNSFRITVRQLFRNPCHASLCAIRSGPVCPQT